MKIVATTRTRNEARNIERFIESYWWVDEVLIADGGSSDPTIRNALRYEGVKVRNFEERVQGANGHWRNPHGRHINFIIDWAKQERADWMIFDDADCVPTRSLQENGRDLIENAQAETVYANRMYVYKNEGYFPLLSSSGNGLWAWKVTSPIRASEANPWQHTMVDNSVGRLDLQSPYALLHYTWPTDKQINEKLRFYRESGEQEAAAHPLTFAGDISPLPKWAVW